MAASGNARLQAGDSVRQVPPCVAQWAAEVSGGKGDPPAANVISPTARRGRAFGVVAWPTTRTRARRVMSVSTSATWGNSSANLLAAKPTRPGGEHQVSLTSQAHAC